MQTVASGKHIRSVLGAPDMIFDDLLTQHPDTKVHDQNVSKTHQSPTSVFKNLGGPLSEIPANKEKERRSNSFNPKDLIMVLRYGDKALRSGEQELKTWTLTPQMVQVRPAQKKSSASRKLDGASANKKKKKKKKTAVAKPADDMVSAVANSFASAFTAVSPAMLPVTVNSLFSTDLFGGSGLDNVFPTLSEEAENLDPSDMFVDVPEESPSKRKIPSSIETNKRTRTSLEGDRVEHVQTFQDFDVGIWWKIKNSKFIVCKFAVDSEAPRKGVKVGDILRSVDGVDILNHKMDEEGHHIADDLLIGMEGSKCNLKLLRVAKRDLTMPRRNGTPLVEFSCSIKRGCVVDDNAASIATGVELHLKGE